MAHPMLPLTLALLAFSVRAESSMASSHALEPCINGEVSASGLFPSQAMEDELASYLRWTKEQCLSRLVAFELLIDPGRDAAELFPTQRMTEQFGAYMRWVEEAGLSPFYAFTAGGGQ